MREYLCGYSHIIAYKWENHDFWHRTEDMVWRFDGSCVIVSTPAVDQRTRFFPDVRPDNVLASGTTRDSFIRVDNTSKKKKNY